MTVSSTQNAGTKLPTGTVTFLFTDIEGSTRLAQETSPDEFRSLIEAHNGLVDTAIVGNGGTVIRTEGDSFFAVFASAPDTVSAAVAAQRALTSHRWPNDRVIRVRMGIHTGEGRLGGADYIGFDVHRAARISATSHGGQVVISADAATLVRHSLPPETTLTDLGRHRLKDLIAPEHLHQVTIDGLPTEFPPLRTSPVSPHKLPIRLTSFVGRTNEVAEAVAMMRSQRLLTLTGPGGTGKTRLAEEVAARVAHDFADGAFFVPVAELRDPELLVPSILERLEVPWSRDADPAPQLVRHLEGKHALLVLDNFEQLLEAAPTVADLLSALPRLSVIVTSRSPLRISGEHEYPVAPLPTPPPEAVGEELRANESVTLFTDRALAVDPGFELTDRNAGAVARIATRLDGLPLGIELVAARARAMPPEIAADRLEGRLVAGGGRDIPERQRTLANTIFDYYTAALAMWRELGVPTETANALYNLAYVTQIRIGSEAANALLVEAEKIYEAAGDRVGLGHVHWSWSNIYQIESDLDRAIASCQRSIEYFDPEHDVFDLGWAEYVLADCLLNAGRIDEARHHLRAGMDLFLGVGDLSATVLFLAGFAQLTKAFGDLDTSARLIGAMQALRQETGAGILDSDPAHQPLARLRRTDDLERQAMIASGAAMTVDEAIALAMERTADP